MPQQTLNSLIKDAFHNLLPLSKVFGTQQVLRYADDTTLMAESEEELKSLSMKVKEESEKVGSRARKLK